MSKVNEVNNKQAQEIIYLAEDVLDSMERLERPITGLFRKQIDAFVEMVKESERRSLQSSD